MSTPRITYTSRSDVASEGEIDALAVVYAFILRCGEARHAEETRKAAGHSDREGR